MVFQMVPSPTCNQEEMDVRVLMSTSLLLQLKDGPAEVASEVRQCTCLSAGAKVGGLRLLRVSSQREPPACVSGFTSWCGGEPTEEPDLQEPQCLRSGLRACLPYRNL